MTRSNRKGGNPSEDTLAAPAAGSRLRSLLAVMLSWARKRVVTAIIAAAASAAFLLIGTGIATDPAAGWAGYASVAAASMLAGLLAGSYVDAPIGADATFCDLRWPVAGLLGTLWANSPREAQPQVQLAVGVLALALMVWALHTRLRLERAATRANNPEIEACTDCRPLFPAKH